MTANIHEEKLKKNTDCVYFLASALTCKKGNDCEFRHSETARLNPRDCWFWSAGKCGKLNCSFRHPPLESLSANYNSAALRKHRSPCFYFAQGYCSKGDKCLFMHELPSAIVKSTAQLASTSTTMPQNQTKPSIDSIDGTDKYRSTGKVNSEFPLESKVAKEALQIESEALLKDDAAKILSPRTCLSPELQDDKVNDVSSRMPATPARGGSHESVSASNKPLQNTTILDAGSNQVCTEDKSQMLAAREAEKLRSVHSLQNRLHDGNESEELVDKTSFDIVVNYTRTNHAEYLDNDTRTNHVEYLDTSCLPSTCAVPVDKLKGYAQGCALLQGQDLVNYDCRHYYDQNSPCCDQFKTPDLCDPSEQYSYCNYMSTFDHHVCNTFRGSVPYMFDAQDIFCDEKNPCTEDLRHHLIKRRQEKSRYSFEKIHCKVQRGAGVFLRNNFQQPHYNRHQCGNRYQEKWIRGRYASDGPNNVCQERSKSWLDSDYFQPDYNKKRMHYEREYCYGNCRNDYRLLDAEGSASGRAYHKRRGFERCDGPKSDPVFESPKPLNLLLEEKHKKQLAGAEAEGGERRLINPSHDLDNAKLFIKEMHSGITDRHVHGASTSRKSISLYGESQEKNAIDRSSDSMKINNIELESDHCLRKTMDTNSSYPDVDTELSLSLSCSREDHISSVD